MTRKFTLVQILLFSLVSFVNGCAELSYDDDSHGDKGEEQIGKTEQEIGNTWDIGIIPGATSCPNGGPLREIHMDDEDNNNKSTTYGWTGATVGSSKTTFRFCRVDGSSFFPLAWASPSNVNAYYAVLKMGSQCPNGSVEFSRYFDNENSSNANWYSGDIQPSWVASNTYMIFCLFKYATAYGSTMTSFPNLGIEYGVFADRFSGFPLAIDGGFVYTDDEDSSNSNAYYANIDWRLDAQRIITSGSNTYLEMSRVR